MSVLLPLLIGAAGLWWVLGIDYFTLPVLGASAYALGALAKTRSRPIPGGAAWAVFLGWAVVAVMAAQRIDEPFALRTLASYLAAGLLVCGAARASSAGQTRNLVLGVVVAGLTAHLVAILAVTVDWPGGFWAAASHFVPSWTLATEMGYQAFWKEAIPPDRWFSGERVRAIFINANYYAMGSLVAAGAGWWLARGKRGLGKALGVAAMAMLPWALWASKSRSALVALVLSLGFIALRGRPGPALWLRWVGAIGLGAFALVWLLTSGDGLLAGAGEYRLQSTMTRLAIYRVTAEASMASPWLGYGGPMDVAQYRAVGDGGFDLGSHSEPLGVLFAYGLPALALFIAAAASLLKRLGSLSGPLASAALWTLTAVGAQALFVRPFWEGIPLAWALAITGAALGEPRAPPTRTAP